MKLKEFAAKLDQEAIVAAISRAEAACSGEIRVHLEESIRGGEIREWAERTFERLGMTKTELRNGVLLFISAREQRFAILGDSGIDARVPAGFWDSIAGQLTRKFQAGELTGGIIEAIEAAGRELAHYFPSVPADRDELSNDISLGPEEKN